MLLLLLFSLLFVFIGRLIYRNISNPITVFNILWLVIFGLYSMNLNGYYEISTLGIVFFTFQTVFFSVGCLIGKQYSFVIKKRVDITVNDKVSHEKNMELRINIFYILCVITIILLLQDTMEVIKYLFSGYTFWDLANEKVISENTTTGLRVIMKIFIEFPITYGISAISATEFFMNDKKNKKILIFNILIVLLYAFQHGGRHILIVFVASYLFVFLISKRSRNLSRKQKIAFAVMFSVFFFISIWLSASRGVENLGESLYNYFAGVVPHADVWINRVALSDDYTLGFGTLNGFISPIVILLRGVGVISKFPDMVVMAGNAISNPEAVTAIGPSIVTNAFVSQSYIFYSDFRLIGVIFGNLIYGVFVSEFYKKSMRTGNKRIISIYVLLMCSVVMGFTRFQFCQYFYSMALLFIALIYKKGNDNVLH